MVSPVPCRILRKFGVEQRDTVDTVSWRRGSGVVLGQRAARGVCLFLCRAGIVSSVGGTVGTKRHWYDDERRQGTIAGKIAKNSEHVRREYSPLVVVGYLCEVVE
jgi:hypothetical protein